MKYSRTFHKKIKNGVLVYNSRPFLPFPLKVNSLIVEAPALPDGNSYEFELSDLGRVISAGEIAVSKSLVFDRPLRVGIGKHEFKVQIRNLPPLGEVDGHIIIDYSFTL